jgi:hypothetical protein
MLVPAAVVASLRRQRAVAIGIVAVGLVTTLLNVLAAALVSGK